MAFDGRDPRNYTIRIRQAMLEEIFKGVQVGDQLQVEGVLAGNMSNSDKTINFGGTFRKIEGSGVYFGSRDKIDLIEPLELFGKPFAISSISMGEVDIFNIGDSNTRVRPILSRGEIIGKVMDFNPNRYNQGDIYLSDGQSRIMYPISGNIDSSRGLIPVEPIKVRYTSTA